MVVIAFCGLGPKPYICRCKSPHGPRFMWKCVIRLDNHRLQGVPEHHVSSESVILQGCCQMGELAEAVAFAVAVTGFWPFPYYTHTERMWSLRTFEKSHPESLNAQFLAQLLHQSPETGEPQPMSPGLISTWMCRGQHAEGRGPKPDSPSLNSKTTCCDYHSCYFS